MVVDYELLGRNIKYFRSKKRMRQAELAELVDVSTPHISHIECNQTKGSLSVLLSIAQALDTDLYTLVGMENPNDQVDVELNEILKNATLDQRKLCFELCRTVIKHSSPLPGS